MLAKDQEDQQNSQASPGDVVQSCPTTKHGDGPYNSIPGTDQMLKNLLARLRKNLFYTVFCLVERRLYNTGQIPLARAACKAIGNRLNTFLRRDNRWRHRS
jgi:hypothetical protein